MSAEVDVVGHLQSELADVEVEGLVLVEDEELADAPSDVIMPRR